MPDVHPAERNEGLPDLLRRLALETDLDAARSQIAREMRVAADAERAQVWLYDPQTESLAADARQESAAVGLTGYVARTGSGLTVDEVGGDPRYDPALDNDGGDPRERFLAWPLLDENESVFAVLTLARSPQAAPFGDEDRRQLDWMTRLLAPALARLADEARRTERHSAIRSDAAQLFRGEALESYHRGTEDEGHLLEIEPAWMRRAYAVILALFAAALLLSLVIRIDRDAEGGGVIRQGRLVAVIPARYRAELRPGLPLRFDLFSQPLLVGSVTPKIVPPSEARRLLGVDGAAFWSGSEPAVRVDAPLPAGGDDYGDGVAGRVRVRLGRERVLVALIPALRRLHV